LPEVPPMRDYIPEFEASTAAGLVAPKTTPPEIIEKLNLEVTAALANQKIVARLNDLGIMTAKSSSVDFGKLIVKEKEKWGRVIQYAGLKTD
jgi:tripartite-type tricarboxylate transporter receptor subunit TctC